MAGMSWIENTFHKRDCVQIIPSTREPHRCLPGCQICQQLVRCCCGRFLKQHSFFTENPAISLSQDHVYRSGYEDSERWTAEETYSESSTNAYGTINFSWWIKWIALLRWGQYKALILLLSYIRLSDDSNVEDILQLMLKEWRMKLPKLVISVHGGTQKFELHPCVKEALSKGFVKAAMTTGAWILTGGINNGVAAHIGDALKEHASRLSHKVYTIGIAPWGIIEGRNDLIGKNVDAPYQTLLNPLSKLHVLNSLHSHFILVDDGTTGKHGGETQIRRELESKLSLHQIHARTGKRIPLVAFILEGGPNTVLTVLEYLHQRPPVPVVVCEGSGRAADLLAFVHKQTDFKGNLPDGTEAEIIASIKKTFNLNKSDTMHLFQMLMACMEIKELITVFHVESEKYQDIDVAILTALLKGTNSSPVDQLALAIAWNRPDIAKNHIFIHGQQWQCGPLEQAMLDALVMDRVEFVKLLIENGVSMHRFLTILRLEELYNSVASNDTFLNLIRDVKSRQSQVQWNPTKNLKKKIILGTEEQKLRPFLYPFNELLMWAVLMKRQKMALFFWQHGEESMAKALVARKLYRSMCHETQQSDVIDDTPEKLKEYSKEFGELAVDLLDHCFKQNERMAMKVLTSELSNWSNSTCLKLAVSARLRPFVAHTCTQMLLSDMWMGRLNMRKHSWFKVILGILIPPIITLLEFKTKAQMSHIPQSQEEHQMAVDNKAEPKSTLQGVPLGVFKETPSSNDNGVIFSETENETKPRHLPLVRKFHAFYHAPIVKFWFNTLAYLAFLMLYTFVVLVKMESFPPAQEWIVISVIITTGVEKIREIFISEAGKIPQKLKVWFSSYMNINDTVAIITFLVGFGLRMGSGRLVDDNTSYDNNIFIAGRLIYCLNIIFWLVRLLDILNVNQDAGPYVLMIGKMVSKMFYIVVIMGLVVICFGVPRKAILYPHAEPSWTLAKDIVFQPYWMTFGEVYAYEINVCANDSVVPHLCGPGTWITPFLQAVYLFVQYIIMVNLLIAFFNHVYMQGKAMSNTLWKFQRYHFIMVYHNKPVLPPPLIVFSHVMSFISWICIHNKKTKLRGPKLFLTEEDLKRLHDFEENCLEIYFNDKKDWNDSQSSERIRVTSERVEHMFNELGKVVDHVSIIKRSLHSLDDHIGHLQDLSSLTYDTLKKLTAEKALATSRSHSVMSCDLSLSRYTSDDGLGRSTIWKKNSDLFWGPSFSHSSLEKVNNPQATKSQRKYADAGFIDSALFQRADSLPEFQQTAAGDENPKSQESMQNSNPIITQSDSHSLTVTPSSEVVTPPYNNFANTSKGDGFVNAGFIDDTGNSTDTYENSSKEAEAQNQLAEAEIEREANHKSVNRAMTCNETNQKINRSEDPAEKIAPALINNKYTDILQKLWNLSKHSESKPHLEKQIAIEINPTRTKTSNEGENKLIRANSCTELTGCQITHPFPSQGYLRMDSSASYDDGYHVDSKAALLTEPHYSRHSSTHNKSPLQKEAFSAFGSHFIPSMDNTFYYSAIERNNLFRLSQNIQFTPLPPKGELVTVFQLEESSPHIMNNSMSSWSQQGVFAKIEFLGREEMGGGLRRAVKVACTWSEYDILKPGKFYILKSFLPEVVNTWSAIYKEDTVLQLCLREIQQQRAAQKLLFAFNQMKPKSIPYSPKFLEVFLLYCHSANQWFTVEECMVGKFRKYNNNTGNENVPTNKLEKTMLAFSHWTYEYTRGEYLVLDLQGVGENLTDPSVIKAGERRSKDMVFGPANLGDDAIKNFCSMHQCNSCCRNLKLPEVKRNDYTPNEAALMERLPSSKYQLAPA
ncbi:LOW QUALITY PROTEIN: transient receptor potential cation channel subfamily M member 7-like [Bombina bombina]|uniref:LOW QUALITY PROTEIN: transient receptor potential cation channel subfamily M member 7-like n=1 Tax=Bombina bombina TaxID=8345 RepID=UPI00235AFCEA|nr:LOW QUALITY PROTEIN: transient receptor potential cation channel subfamily M member 7-like [Bombina bombina]